MPLKISALRFSLLLVVLGMLALYKVSAQELPKKFHTSNCYFGSSVVLVKTDPNSQTAIGNIPFDRCFHLRIYINSKSQVPKSVWLLGVFEPKASASKVEMDFLYLPKDPNSDDTNLKRFDAIDVVIPQLLPEKNFKIELLYGLATERKISYLKYFKLLYENKCQDADDLFVAQQLDKNGNYKMSVENVKLYYQQKKLNEIFKKYTSKPDSASIVIANLMETENMVKVSDKEEIELFSSGVSANGNTYTSTIEASSGTRLFADAGLVYAGFQEGFNKLMPYIGLNYSFRAFNTDVPFALIKNRIKWHERISLNAGLTLKSLAKNNQREDLFESKNLIVGAGYRISHVLCLTGGGIFYNKIGPNPLFKDKRLGVVPYVGFSINLKIKAALGELAKLFSYGS